MHFSLRSILCFDLKMPLKHWGPANSAVRSRHGCHQPVCPWGRSSPSPAVCAKALTLAPTSLLPSLCHSPRMNLQLGVGLGSPITSAQMEPSARWLHMTRIAQSHAVPWAAGEEHAVLLASSSPWCPGAAGALPLGVFDVSPAIPATAQHYEPGYRCAKPR